MSFKYVKEGDKRPIASVIVCGRRPSPPVQSDPEPDTPEEEKPEQTIPPAESEETPVEDNKKEEMMEVIKDETWTDPEPQPTSNIIVERIAALLSVKSLITIFLTVIFGLLVLRGEELPDKFVSVYTMCISFFFGYQFKKAEGGADK
jgi:hypothetical protein